MNRNTMLSRDDDLRGVKAEAGAKQERGALAAQKWLSLLAIRPKLDRKSLNREFENLTQSLTREELREFAKAAGVPVIP